MTEDEFQSLVDSVCDLDRSDADCIDPRDLTPAQSRELAALLAAEPLLREALSERHSFASGVVERLKASDADEQRQFREGILVRLRQRRRPALARAIPWGVAASLALLLAWSQLPRGGGPTTDPVAPVDPAPTAVLVAVADAEFAPGHSPDGVRFDPGKYVLRAGSIHLRFLNGVDLGIHGPATFDIKSALHIDLAEGITRALVPESGTGFTIATAEMEIIDLGTEFGVSASPAASEVLVFDGSVDVVRAGGAKRQLRTNESMRLKQTGEAGPAEIPAESYPTPASIRHRQWERWSEAIKSDPDLLLYLPLQQQPGDDGLLETFSVLPNPPEATVRGARWVTGRWPEKGGLLFDRDGDHVEFDLGGGFEELTICLWIKLNRVDHPITALANSNSWHGDRVHFQVRRNGDLGGHFYAEEEARFSPPTPFTTGRWVHVAYVISTRESQNRVYVNGEPSALSPISADRKSISPGKMRLGDWVPIKSHPTLSELKRGLRGFIDECLIFRRALTSDEISNQVTQGRPSFLWR